MSQDNMDHLISCLTAMFSEYAKLANAAECNQVIEDIRAMLEQQDKMLSDVINEQLRLRMMIGETLHSPCRKG